MSNYLVGLHDDDQPYQFVGANPFNKSGVTSIVATVGIGALIVFAFTRKPKRYPGADMSDVEARMRSRGYSKGQIRSYGW